MASDGPESGEAPPADADKPSEELPAGASDTAARAEELDLPPRPPIRESPVHVLPIIAKKTPLDALFTRWQPLLEKLPAGSQVTPVDETDAWLSWNETHSYPIPMTGVRSRGVGQSLEVGFILVDAPLVLAVLDDGAFDPLDCLKLWESIDLVDIACACRSIGGAPWPVAAFERGKAILARVFLGYDPDPRVGWSGWSGWRGRWIARRGFGVPVADPLAGMFLARTAVLRGLPIQSHGSFAWTELIAKANHTECLLTDVAVAATKPVAGDADFAADAWRLFSHPDFGPPRRS